MYVRGHRTRAVVVDSAVCDPTYPCANTYDWYEWRGV